MKNLHKSLLNINSNQLKFNSFLRKFIFTGNFSKNDNEKIPRYYFESFLKRIPQLEIIDNLLNSIDINKEKELTPTKIKQTLDEYIIGQDKVKKAIANALRNRYRKRKLMEDIKYNKFITQEKDDKEKKLNQINEEYVNELIKSHNILITGKSGSGKTEIVRQTAKISNSPFIKVDAVKYTEVGYIGDDVENIINDLFIKTRKEFEKNIEKTFWEIESVKLSWEKFIFQFLLGNDYVSHLEYEYYRKKLHNDEINNLDLNIWYYDLDRVEKFTIGDLKKSFWSYSKYVIEGIVNLNDIIKVNIENRAIVCIDEFDKLIKSKNDVSGGIASSEGVQNDFLPLFDGTEVFIKELKNSNFSINTKNILFVALGAFTKNKPSDLITEIQGRLPIHCSVEALKPKDFKEILKKSKLSVLNQVVLLMKSEGIEIVFNDDAIDEIAEISYYINQTHEDTGARRLMSVLNIVLNDITFYAPEIYNEYKTEDKDIVLTIDKEYVKRACEDEVQRIKDHKKYIV